MSLTREIYWALIGVVIAGVLETLHVPYGYWIVIPIPAGIGLWALLRLGNSTNAREILLWVLSLVVGLVSVGFGFLMVNDYSFGRLAPQPLPPQVVSFGLVVFGGILAIISWQALTSFRNRYIRYR